MLNLTAYLFSAEMDVKASFCVDITILLLILLYEYKLSRSKNQQEQKGTRITVIVKNTLTR